MEIMMKGKYYEEESIIRRKVLWEGKDYQKKVSSEGKYVLLQQKYCEKEIIMRWKVLCKSNYFKREDIIMRKFVGHFYEKESIFKSFHQFG